jgi:hypothetical protein
MNRVVVHTQRASKLFANERAMKVIYGKFSANFSFSAILTTNLCHNKFIKILMGINKMKIHEILVTKISNSKFFKSKIL